MSPTTIRGSVRPALQLLTVFVVSALLSIAGPVIAPQADGFAAHAAVQHRAHHHKDHRPQHHHKGHRTHRHHHKGHHGAHAVPLGERVVAAAASQAGDRYVYGASGPGAFDCSGLTQFVYRVVTGKRLPHSSSAQQGSTRRVPARGARRGDLVFFHKGGGVYHVAIYAGRHRIWHAPYPGARVRKERIWTPSVTYGRVR